MAFRHALVRDAFYGDIPWTRRVALHRAVAERLETGHAASVLVAEHWVLGRRPEQARAALLRAAEASSAVHAYRDAERAIRRALELWPDGDDEAGRLDVLERLAGYAELAGDLADAVPTWREVADRYRRDNDLLRAGNGAAPAGSCTRAAGSLARGTQQPGAGRVAFTAAGLPADAAAERIASAAHLRSAGSFRAAISLLQIAGEQAREAHRVDLEARILGHEGNARARMGEGPVGVDLVRSGLAMALEHGLTGAAAEIYQRLADALEHTGDYAAAKETYDEAFSFCSTNALEPTAQLCLACLTAVLRQSGDWDRATVLCRQVIASTEATLHARAVATGMLGSILGMRGQTKRARPLLLESLTLARADRVGCDGAAVHLGLGDCRSAGWGSRVGCWPLLVDSRAMEADRGSSLRSLAAALGDHVLRRIRETVPKREPAPRRWPGLPPTLVSTRRCRRCRMHLVRPRFWTAARTRRRAISPRRFRCCPAGIRPSTARSPSAAPLPP